MSIAQVGWRSPAFSFVVTRFFMLVRCHVIVSEKKKGYEDKTVETTIGSVSALCCTPQLSSHLTTAPEFM